MKKAYFITGTDTGVGKTFVTAALARALKKTGLDCGVMKPVETGCRKVRGKLYPEDAAMLKAASGSRDPLDRINPYRFGYPLAPSVAARLEGKKMDFGRIKRCFIELARRHDVMLVEGVGGLLVPMDGKKTVADLVVYLKVPLIIVAPSRLGCINHALLTVEAARKRGIEVRGIILNSPSPAGGKSDMSLRFNPGEIERLTGVKVGCVPFIKKGASSLEKRGPFEVIRIRYLLI